MVHSALAYGDRLLLWMRRADASLAHYRVVLWPTGSTGRLRQLIQEPWARFQACHLP